MSQELLPAGLTRYKRRLETCPQANLHQSGREYFRRRVENTRVHFGANSPVSVKSPDDASLRVRAILFLYYFNDRNYIK